MNRKQFIRNGGILALSPFVLNALSGCNVSGKKKPVIVIIQLVGGNDGLNTLIPLDNYSVFADARPNLFIPENKILQFNGASAIGLHPSLKGIRDLYNDKFVSFVQGVGYLNQSYSHFRSTDIYLSGSDATTVLDTGWMARFLETEFSNYPQGFPNSQKPHPPAIKIGDTGSFLFQGYKMDMSIVIDPITGIDSPDIDSGESRTGNIASGRINYIRNILLQTQHYVPAIKKALASSFQHSTLYPAQGKNPLADQLKIVAKLINGNLDTSVYMVDLKGFDTHNAQVDPSDTTKGSHSQLLDQLSQAITSFWDDMVHIGKENDLLGMTISEFGRRIKSNASFGTDHGSSQPIMLFGGRVNNAIFGANPSIPDRVSVEDNLTVQYNFKTVYASVLKNWMGASQETVKNILGGSYPDIRIIKS